MGIDSNEYEAYKLMHRKLLQLRAMNRSILPISSQELSKGEFRIQIGLRADVLKDMRSIQSRLMNLIQEANCANKIELCRTSRFSWRRRPKAPASSRRALGPY